MEQSQVLCILNTRKAVQQVYQQLSGEGNYCLTTYLYPRPTAGADPRDRQRLSNGLPCRVVATSLIEAGVDVDFPTLYRQLAGLDSILQAAGRCNREGIHSPEESIVTVFQLQDAPSEEMIQKNIEACQDAIQAHPELEHQTPFGIYFSKLYYQDWNHDESDILKRSPQQKSPFPRN